MDHDGMMAAIKAARDCLHKLAMGSDHVIEDTWMHIQSLDHVLENAAKPSDVAEIAARFIHEGAHRLGFYVGAVKSLTARHPWLDSPYAPVGLSAPLERHYVEAGRDLWMVMNMIKQQERDHEANDQRTKPAGRPGEGSKG